MAEPKQKPNIGPLTPKYSIRDSILRRNTGEEMIVGSRYTEVELVQKPQLIKQQ